MFDYGSFIVMLIETSLSFGLYVNQVPLSNLKNPGEELFRWDIYPFIMHKRASTVKCHLEQVMGVFLLRNIKETYLLSLSLVKFIQFHSLFDLVCVFSSC